MSDSDSDLTMAPPPVPIKRFGLGVRAVIQIILAAVSLTFIYYLAISYSTRKDLTQDGIFTLSEASQNLLASDDLQAREKPVKLIAALRKTSPHYDRLRPIIEEYERLSGGQIELDIFDPILDSDRALEVENNYSSTLQQNLFSDDLLIFDARDGLKPEEGATQSSLNKHLRYLEAKSLLVKRTDKNKQRRVVGFQDEEMISSALQLAVEGAHRIMYLVEDKSDLDVGELDSPWQVLTEALLKQNILLAPIKISQVEKIPENAQGLVIVAPEYDFEDEELRKLQEYWNRPAASIIAYLDPTHRPPKLRSFLRKHGVSPRDDRILRTRNGRTETQVLSTFTSGTEVNDSLEEKSVPFEGRIGSLEVREGAEDLVSRGIQAFTLIESAGNYWGEVDYRQPDPTFDPNKDEAGPLAIAAAVIKGNSRADRTADQVSKMIVMSTSDFLDPQRLGSEQIDFVKNSTLWLLGREDLMGIGPRSIQRRKLNLIKEEVGLLNNIVIFFIPAGLFLIAMMVWNARRA